MKFLYIHTWGTRDPERTATPFYMATTAALMDFDVTMVFTIHGTSLLKKGAAGSVYVKEGGVPLSTFVNQALDAGVKFAACAASLDLNNMTREDLIPEVHEIIGATAINDMAAEADVVMTF